MEVTCILLRNDTQEYHIKFYWKHLDSILIVCKISKLYSDIDRNPGWIIRSDHLRRILVSWNPVCDILSISMHQTFSGSMRLKIDSCTVYMYDALQLVLNFDNVKHWRSCQNSTEISALNTLKAVLYYVKFQNYILVSGPPGILW